MNVVATTHNLRIGGSQGYLLLVGEQLERLGHHFVVHAPEREGPLADLAAERGIRVARSESALPEACDVVLVQDGMMAHRLAEAYPRVPQVFRCPSELFDLQLPPQLPGLVGATVALSERVAQRLRALALSPEVVRLTQPVDTSRFGGGEALRARPRRAVLLGNYLQGPRRELLIETWGAAGVQCEVAGNLGEPTLEPERVLADADIVVAKGRAAVEAMASGRAVYVYDQFGGDGWITPQSYRALEADNFAGQATAAVPSAEALARDLATYDPQMGMANRDLAVRHHCARRHAEALVGVLAGAAPRAESPDVPHRELSRLVQVQWQTELRGFGLAAENRALLGRLKEAERERNSERARANHAERAEEASRARAREAERRLGRLTERPAFRAALAAKRAVGTLAGRLRDTRAG